MPAYSSYFDLALDVADALQDHLLRGLRGDAPEVVRGVVPLADDLALLVELLGDDVDVAGLDVDLDERLLGGVRHALVRGDERVGERLEHDLDGDALLALDVLQRLHHLGVHRWAASRVARPARLPLTPHSKTVRAWATSP